MTTGIRCVSAEANLSKIWNGSSCMASTTARIGFSLSYALFKAAKAGSR